MTAPADSSSPTKVLSIDHTLLVFSFIFLLVIAIQSREFTQKVTKNEEDNFTFYKFSSFYINVVETILPQQ